MPEGCISKILSLTSPKDAGRSSAVSQTFMSAAESDVVWESFLPSDYEDIVSTSNSPMDFPSKKQLYFSLCNSPILLDGGKLSFSLDKKTGKKCFMVAARELGITWGNTPAYWEWLSHLNSSFRLMPEGCISKILSLTSPKDAGRSSAVSQTFMSAAESDVVWESFLPSDYKDIVSRSDSPMDFPSKKQLYFSLFNSPILLDGGKLSFSLDKKTGKKCYMVSARELVISWGNTPHYWIWSYRPDSRFSEVADLRFVYWHDMRGRIDTRLLSKRTKYVVYLVFKVAGGSYGLENANAFVRFIDCESNDEAEERPSVVNISVQPDENRHKRRVDGWLEIEMGNFFNDAGEDGDVEARLMETRRIFTKGGLIVQGMEFRPK
ncbi:F-box protein [Capsicum chinense]|nr:F-box protein [Capsicum chinense]